jgi:protein TonB
MPSPATIRPESAAASGFPRALGISLVAHAAALGGLVALSAGELGGERAAVAAQVAFEPAPAPPPRFALAAREADLPLESEPFDAPPEPVEARVVEEPEPPPRPEAVDLDALAHALPLRPLTQAAPEPAAPDPTPVAVEPEPVPPSEPAETVVAGERPDVPPALLDAPPPRYPTQALALGLEGTVLVRITVAADGSVARVAVEAPSGFAPFDEAALEAIRAWRFRPGLRAGLAAELDLLHRVRFELRR